MNVRWILDSLFIFLVIEIGSDGAEGAENGGWHWLAVSGCVDLVFVPAPLQAATVGADREDDVSVLEFSGRSDVDVCVPVLASLDDLSRKVSGVELTGSSDRVHVRMRLSWDYCMQAVSMRVTHAAGDGGLSSAPERIMRWAPE